jgi:hypothetical protein
MKKWIILGMLALTLALTASVATADHSWNGYHWARQSASFNLKLGDNVTSSWDPYLRTAATDWSASSVLDTTVVAGSSPKCTFGVSGRVEVCNRRYGFNGWLGIAQIWVSGDHIIAGLNKLNDSYFSTKTYNTPAWRRLVVCQEVAHTFGLDHQDVIFNNPNLGSCMDYTNDPDGPPSNEHPNEHDYTQLGIIYSHLDGTTTVGQTTGMPAPRSGGDDDDNDFGAPHGNKKDGDGRDILFAKNKGGGQTLYTWVVWAGHGNPDKP